MTLLLERLQWDLCRSEKRADIDSNMSNGQKFLIRALLQLPVKACIIRILSRMKWLLGQSGLTSIELTLCAAEIINL